jgi:hypothetical protein
MVPVLARVMVSRLVERLAVALWVPSDSRTSPKVPWFTSS